MAKIKWETYKNKLIMYIDYTNINTIKPEGLKQLKEVIEEVRAGTDQATDTIYYLSDVTNSIANSAAMKLLQDVAQYTIDSGKCGKMSVVGITGIKKSLLGLLNVVMHANQKGFDTIQQAKEWLVS
jgi:hypothetical protein